MAGAALVRGVASVGPAPGPEGSKQRPEPGLRRSQARPTRLTSLFLPLRGHRMSPGGRPHFAAYDPSFVGPSTGSGGTLCCCRFPAMSIPI